MSMVEVAIGPGHARGLFRVEVVRSAAGNAAAEVSLDAEILLARRAQFEQTLLASGVATRHVLSAAERAIRETGQVLFSALLGAGKVAGLYRASVALADERGDELRIDTPELAGLPWEAMYDADAGGYVCRQHQLVRHVPVAAVPPPLQVRPPLRILGVICAPRGLPALDADREREQLTRALARPTGQGLTQVTWARVGTWDGLHEMLLAGPWHVLHFIGHGDFDPDKDEGVLALTRDDGRADLVEASRFADLLRQARPMPRLVVLNSCSGATTGSQDLFSGTAAALTRSGIGAVAAMQYPISDSAAVAFARGFYAALALGLGVDEAMSAGRIAILGISAQTLEWITPVLYLRGQDARMFAIPAGDNRPQPPPMAQPARIPLVEDAPVRHVPSRIARILIGHTGAVCGVAFSPKRTLLATAGYDESVRLWDPATGAAVRILSGHAGAVFKVAFSPDGTLLATAGYDQSVRLWDVDTGEAVRILSGHAGTVWGVAFSPDGTLLATAGYDQSVRLWDVGTGEAVRILSGHADSVWGVAFSPDGTLLATAGDDESVRLWDPATGAAVRILSGHAGAVSGVAFSPDGTLLATAGYDQSVRLWDPATGAAVRILSGHAGAVFGVAFSPDGTLLVWQPPFRR